jgi:hypothetical protein
MWVVAGEAVIGADTLGNHVNVASSNFRVHARVCSTWVVVSAYQSECHHTPAASVDSDCGIAEVVVRNCYEALLEQLPGMRIQHVIGDASLGGSPNGYSGIEPGGDK